MALSPDILFTAEYIKNVLYFATVRHGKILKNSGNTHYFCIDDELVYNNYYSDFGPLNLGCVYKYCKLLQDKLKIYLNKQIIIHYTSIDPKKEANAAFLLGAYGVLYLSLQPRDALKPLLARGQSYRPFQDATQGDSLFTISIMDCLQALQKARESGFFNFQDFNYEEYESLDKIQGGDLNWIIPGKFLAFIGPVDYSVSLHHPPELYINYFLENNVRIVIRLNKRFYDGNVFNEAGIDHYDLFFPDGSCPPRHILLKFLQISEGSKCAIGVHCKAGLGRTGSLIGCYLIKHYRFTAHEAIGWMRICRPGSVIGHQQGWLEQLESWLVKQGNIYRKRLFNDTERLPNHNFGIYSISEKTLQKRPLTIHKSPSPPPALQRQGNSDFATTVRPKASRPVHDKSEDEEEIFLSSCDLTVKSAIPLTQLKVTKETEKEQFEWCVRTSRNSSQKIYQAKGKDIKETSCSNISRQSSGAGEPKVPGSHSKSSSRSQIQRSSAKSNISRTKDTPFEPAITTFRTTNGPAIKNVHDAKNFLLRSSKHNEERERQLLSSVIVTPHSHNFGRDTIVYPKCTKCNMMHTMSPSFNPEPRGPTQPAQRRRLGRSPSPPSARMSTEQTRATNTTPVTPKERYAVKDSNSKSGLSEALSRLKYAVPTKTARAGSIGAASLEARRDAPAPRRAPSVRSDERPTATQGDLLNSIKFQKRLRGSLQPDKIHLPTPSKDKANVKRVNSKTSSGARLSLHDNNNLTRDNPPTVLRKSNQPRPASPKGRRSPHHPIN